MYEIGAVRTELSDDGTHVHIQQIGYRSPHVPQEEIFIPIPRALQKIAFAETFWVQLGDERAEVSTGKCPVCGFEPYLKTSKDSGETQVLLSLPRK